MAPSSASSAYRPVPSVPITRPLPSCARQHSVVLAVSFGGRSFALCMACAAIDLLVKIIHFIPRFILVLASFGVPLLLLPIGSFIDLTSPPMIALQATVLVWYTCYFPGLHTLQVKRESFLRKRRLLQAVESRKSRSGDLQPLPPPQRCCDSARAESAHPTVVRADARSAGKAGPSITGPSLIAVCGRWFWQLIVAVVRASLSTLRQVCSLATLYAAARVARAVLVVVWQLVERGIRMLRAEGMDCGDDAVDSLGGGFSAGGGGASKQLKKARGSRKYSTRSARKSAHQRALRRNEAEEAERERDGKTSSSADQSDSSDSEGESNEHLSPQRASFRERESVKLRGDEEEKVEREETNDEGPEEQTWRLIAPRARERIRTQAGLSCKSAPPREGRRHLPSSSISTRSSNSANSNSANSNSANSNSANSNSANGNSISSHVGSTTTEEPSPPPHLTEPQLCDLIDELVRMSGSEEKEAGKFTGAAGLGTPNKGMHVAATTKTDSAGAIPGVADDGSSKISSSGIWGNGSDNGWEAGSSSGTSSSALSRTSSSRSSCSDSGFDSSTTDRSYDIHSPASPSSPAKAEASPHCVGAYPKATFQRQQTNWSQQQTMWSQQQNQQQYQQHQQQQQRHDVAHGSWAMWDSSHLDVVQQLLGEVEPAAAHTRNSSLLSNSSSGSDIDFGLFPPSMPVAQQLQARMPSQSRLDTWAAVSPPAATWSKDHAGCYSSFPSASPPAPFPSCASISSSPFSLASLLPLVSSQSPHPVAAPASPWWAQSSDISPSCERGLVDEGQRYLWSTGGNNSALVDLLPETLLDY